jgi:spore coat polysaccharide biosynthesis protein SpsF
MEALKFVSCELRILACPEDCAEAFAPLARETGFELSLGSKDDVLARYCHAIRRFGPDRVIRATGDNPFVFADAADALSREAEALKADYAGYSGLPYGAGVESVSAGALLKAGKEALAGPEREHVCPYLYGNPGLFRLHRPLAPPRWQEPGLRITVDTKEDYRRAEALYTRLAALPAAERYNGEAVIFICKKIEREGRK